MSTEFCGGADAASSLDSLRDDSRDATWPGPLAIAAIFALFTAAWLVYGVFSHTGMVLHDDVTEAYVWGQEFQLGYNQHPPFWAWVAGLWFLVFPNREWAFLLLAVLNSAVGLLGAWYLIGRFASGHARQAAWLLLLCTPFYTFSCFKYNANSVFLSIWPWTLFFFMRALESRRVRDGVWFGIMIGAAIMSKYFAGILVLTCLAGSMLHPNARPYWRSASPWTSIAVAVVLVLPHLIWLVINHAPPVQYALATIAPSLSERIGRSMMVLLAVIGLQIAIPILIWLTRRRGAVAATARDIRLLTALAVLPTTLTIGFGLLFGFRLSAEMLIGTFPLTPVLATSLMPGTDPRRLVRWTSRAVAAGMLVILMSLPVTIRLLQRPTDPSWDLPLREAAETGSALWHQATGRRLVTVGGTKYFSNAAAFYSDDRPAGFLELDPALAPWVTAERLRTGGLLAMCLREDGPWDDKWCRGNAARLATPRTTVTRVTLTHRVRGEARGTATLDIYITPPGP